MLLRVVSIPLSSTLRGLGGPPQYRRFCLVRGLDNVFRGFVRQTKSPVFHRIRLCSHVPL
jgi:hypothetical protein